MTPFLFNNFIQKGNETRKTYSTDRFRSLTLSSGGDLLGGVALSLRLGRGTGDRHAVGVGGRGSDHLLPPGEEG